MLCCSNRQWGLPRGREMKNIYMVLAGLLLAGSAWAADDRLIVTDNKAMLVFIQKNSIVHKDKYVEAWVTSDYEHMRSMPDGGGYLCQKQQKLFDCSGHRVAIETTYYFDQDECAGSVVYRESHPHPVFNDIAPNSENDREFHTVCNVAFPESAKKHPH